MRSLPRVQDTPHILVQCGIYKVPRAAIASPDGARAPTIVFNRIIFGLGCNQAHSAEADIFIAENIVVLLRLDKQPLYQVSIRSVSHGHLHDIREHLRAELLRQHHLLMGVRILHNVI